MHLRAFVKGAALGAAAAYLFDPDSGDGRRARLRDQAGALVRQGRERADELSRHAGNVVEGKLHELSGTTDLDRPMDDATIADRIRSEVLGRRGDLKADGVVVNVENGKAQLRGAAPSSETIEDIVDRTRAVAGVLDVENLMHLPDAPAPNKKAARSTGQRTSSS
jgi:osmotically-inducible protein OsmY